MFRTGAQMAILIVIAGLCLWHAASHWPINAADDAFTDHLALADSFLKPKLGRTPAAAPVVLIAIDDPSLAGHPWPWSPLDFSLFLRAIEPFKPGVVAIEEILDWNHTNLPANERQKLPQYERMLRDSLLRTPKVLLGQRLGWPEDPDALPPIEATPILRHVSGRLREIPEGTVIADQAKEEFRLSSTVGYTNLAQGLPSTTTIPLVLRYQGEIVPSFVLQAILLWQRLTPDDAQVVLGSHIDLAGKLRIPIDDRGEMRLNFAAQPTRIGYDSLLLAAEKTAAKLPPTAPVDRIAGEVTLLARTDPGSQTLPMALGKKASPGEVFAYAIATIQSGAFLHDPPRWFSAALVAIAAVIGFWIPRLRKARVALTCALVFLAYLLAALAAFEFLSLCLPIILPAGLLLFIALYRAATPNSVWNLRRPIIL